jgi:hypothetical protein
MENLLLVIEITDEKFSMTNSQWLRNVAQGREAPKK